MTTLVQWLTAEFAQLIQEYIDGEKDPNESTLKTVGKAIYSVAAIVAKDSKLTTKKHAYATAFVADLKKMATEDLKSVSESTIQAQTDAFKTRVSTALKVEDDKVSKIVKEHRATPGTYDHRIATCSEVLDNNLKTFASYYFFYYQHTSLQSEEAAAAATADASADAKASGERSLLLTRNDLIVFFIETCLKMELREPNLSQKLHLRNLFIETLGNLNYRIHHEPKYLSLVIDNFLQRLYHIEQPTSALRASCDQFLSPIALKLKHKVEAEMRPALLAAAPAAPAAAAAAASAAAVAVPAAAAVAPLILSGALNGAADGKSRAEVVLGKNGADASAAQLPAQPQAQQPPGTQGLSQAQTPAGAAPTLTQAQPLAHATQARAPSPARMQAAPAGAVSPAAGAEADSAAAGADPIAGADDAASDVTASNGDADHTPPPPPTSAADQQSAPAAASAPAGAALSAAAAAGGPAPAAGASAAAGPTRRKAVGRSKRNGHP